MRYSTTQLPLKAYGHGYGTTIITKDSLQDWIRPDGDPSTIVEKALTNMIFEKAVEYHRSPNEFITA